MKVISAPDSGAVVRMFRAGHGDCFLLTFRKTDGTPFHMLMDCGMKSGSQTSKTFDLSDVVNDIHAATNGVLDLVVVTHEHQDHVSGFPREGQPDHPFRKMKVNELWLAWTEDGDDPDANRFREIFGDQLLTLAMAQHKLSQAPQADAGQLTDLTEFLELETGQSAGLAVLQDAAAQIPIKHRGKAFGFDAADDAFHAVFGASKRVKGARYKRRLQGLRRKATKIRFLSPGEGPLTLPDVPDVRIYPFGPPRELDLLKSMDPRKGEEFHAAPFAVGDPGAEQFAALSKASAQVGGSPFSKEHAIPEADILGSKPERRSDDHSYLYGTYAIKKNAARRIDGDWVRDAGALALRINNEVNNTSLVLGIELVRSGKVLLFTGDAQRGSWKSWAGLSWTVNGAQVTAKELLGRCTFYKAGHHGSHNATLKGTIDSPHANLDWLAQGAYADAFVTMIPTNKVWAYAKKRPWKHPLASIEAALYAKAKSRVMMIKSKEPKWRPPFDGNAHSQMRKAFDDKTKVTARVISHWIADEPV